MLKCINQGSICVFMRCKCSFMFASILQGIRICFYSTVDLLEHQSSSFDPVPLLLLSTPAPPVFFSSFPICFCFVCIVDLSFIFLSIYRPACHLSSASSHSPSDSIPAVCHVASFCFFSLRHFCILFFLLPHILLSLLLF